MNVRKIALATALAAAPCFSASAAGLSYNYAQLSYVRVDVGDTNVDSDGVEILGSMQLSDPMFVFGSYTYTESDDVDFFGTSGSFETNSVSVGAGYRAPIQDMMGMTNHEVDFNATAAVLWADTEGQDAFSGAGDDDVGFILSAGARAQLIERFELNGNVTYVDIFEDNDVRFGVGGVFDITPMFAAVAGFAIGSDDDMFNLGVRWNFTR